MPDSILNLTADELRELNAEFKGSSPDKILGWAWQRFGQQAAIGTSFQGAGLALIHIARKNGFDFSVFTLDTGLLFPETLELKKRLENFFGIEMESLTPELSVERQNEVNGPELWKRDPDLCCTMRKVLPLRAKLATLDCWITGLRRDQSAGRDAVEILEVYAFDQAAGRDVAKLNPMADWTRAQVWDYVRENKIPYNPLKDQGYPSIGCQPCTRPAGEGQDERAGRWTGFEKTECGIHTFLPKRGET